MIGDVKPIGHVPPLAPIDLHTVRKSEPPTEFDRMMNSYNRAVEVREGDRIWALLVQACEGDG